MNAISQLSSRVSWALPVGVAVIAYSWLSTGLRPFTVPIDVAVGAPVLILLGVSWRRSRLGAPSRTELRPARFGVAVWASLIGALTAWELAAYLASPRHAHPTLSSISDTVTSGHPARALVFAVWVVLGWKVFVPKPIMDASHR